MKKILIYGMGVSGLGAEKLLKKQGLDYFCYDDIKSTEDEKKYVYENLQQFTTIIKSPGISNENEIIKKSIENGIEIIDEIELAYRYSNYKIIAVTGTNGKTTTTTKIKELLEFAGYKTAYAGNIGKSFAELVVENIELDYLVLELSSYQLETIKDFKAYISMIINLTPDHLNRYKTLKEYYDAKLNITNNQDENCYTIINTDDIEIMNRENSIKNKVNKIYVSKNEKNTDIFVKNNKLYYKNKEYFDTEKFTLKGVHNLENILFITATAFIIGIDEKIVSEFLYNTKGLEHRMEEFYNFKNIKFLNDSKGTNIDATIKALDSFEEKVILICGGKDKKLNLEPLGELIKNKTKYLFLIGETADILEEIAIKYGYEKNKIYNLKTIENVVNKIKDILNPNEKNIVLFSPAASSFDQFKSFEERGKIFKDIVCKLYE